MKKSEKYIQLFTEAIEILNEIKFLEEAKEKGIDVAKEFDIQENKFVNKINEINIVKEQYPRSK